MFQTLSSHELLPDLRSGAPGGDDDDDVSHTCALNLGDTEVGAQGCRGKQPARRAIMLQSSSKSHVTCASPVALCLLRPQTFDNMTPNGTTDVFASEVCQTEENHSIRTGDWRSPVDTAMTCYEH